MKTETKEIELLQTLRQMMTMINKQATEIQTLEDKNKKLQDEINQLKFKNQELQKPTQENQPTTQPQPNPYITNNFNINVYA